MAGFTPPTPERGYDCSCPAGGVPRRRARATRRIGDGVLHTAYTRADYRLSLPFGGCSAALRGAAVVAGRPRPGADEFAPALGPEPQVAEVLLAHQEIEVVERGELVAVPAVAPGRPPRHEADEAEPRHRLDEHLGDELVPGDRGVDVVDEPVVAEDPPLAPPREDLGQVDDRRPRLAADV